MKRSLAILTTLMLAQIPFALADAEEAVTAEVEPAAQVELTEAEAKVAEKRKQIEETEAKRAEQRKQVEEMAKARQEAKAEQKKEAAILREKRGREALVGPLDKP